MSERRVFVLAHAEARRRAMAAVAEAPDGMVVEVREQRRNLDQNALLHALLTEIAERCEWAGGRHDADTWKRLLTGAWCRANREPVTMLPALDGQGVEIVFRKTSTLTRRECADLITYVQAWMAERPEFEKAEA